MKVFIAWLLSALAVVIGSYIIPGVAVSSFWVALIVAVVLAVINLTVKPFLLLITLPINVLTLGLFTFVINTLMIMLAAKIVDGFTVDNFWSALIFGVVTSIITSLMTDK